MRVILETDSRSAIQLITRNKVVTGYNGILVDGCRALIEQDWVVKIIHIYREANRVAD